MLFRSSDARSSGSGANITTINSLRPPPRVSAQMELHVEAVQMLEEILCYVPDRPLSDLRKYRVSQLIEECSTRSSAPICVQLVVTRLSSLPYMDMSAK